MGLLETVDLRPCDKQARELLGPRANSVFAPPSRPLLSVATIADARELIAAAKASAPATKGLSAQAYVLDFRGGGPGSVLCYLGTSSRTKSE